MNQTGQEWEELGTQQQERVARLCLKRARDRPQGLQRAQLEGVDSTRLAQQLTTYYLTARRRQDPIAEACDWAVRGAVPQVRLELGTSSASFGNNQYEFVTRKTPFALRGSVEPADTEVFLARGSRARQHVETRDGRFAIRVPVRRNSNHFTLTAELPTHRPKSASILVTRFAPLDGTDEPEPKPKTDESPPIITVPNVVGIDHQLAQDTMQAAGLYFLREVDCTGQDRLLIWDRNWEVVSQDPVAGTEVSSDTTITLCSKKDDE